MERDKLSLSEMIKLQTALLTNRRGARCKRISFTHTFSPIIPPPVKILHYKFLIEREPKQGLILWGKSSPSATLVNYKQTSLHIKPVIHQQAQAFWSDGGGGEYHSRACGTIMPHSSMLAELRNVSRVCRFWQNALQLLGRNWRSFSGNIDQSVHVVPDTVTPHVSNHPPPPTTPPSSPQLPEKFPLPSSFLTAD